MRKYWLKEKLGCDEPFSCSQCSKVLGCVDKAAGKKSKDSECKPKRIPEGYRFSREHQQIVGKPFPDKEFKESRGCRKIIPCNSCIEFFFRCFPKRR